MNEPHCYDCHDDVNMEWVALCSKHASVDRLIEALEELRGWFRDQAEFNTGLAVKIGATLDELKQTTGTQMPEPS